MLSALHVMKIVFIGCRDINLLGGIESYMYNLTRELVKLGHTPIVYCESNRNSVEVCDGVKVIHMTGFKSNLLCKPWVGLKATIRTLIKEKRVSIIHYNAWPPSIWSFLPRLFRVKSLMQGHGLEWQRTKYSPRQQKILKFMERVTAHINQHLIMCSAVQVKYFKDTYKKDSITIPTAVHLPSSDGKDDNAILKKYGLQSRKYFLFMARLVQDKNPDYLIEGFKACQYGNMRLVIAGSNDSDPEYVKRLHEISAGNDNIVFTGAIYGDEKDAILRNAYVFCIPSTIEGLSIVLLEAMSYKLPVIASDIDANRELLDDNAVWVRPENIEDISNAIEFCISNRDLIENYTMNNYRKVVEFYTWDKVAKKYVEYLKGLGVN